MWKACTTLKLQFRHAWSDEINTGTELHKVLRCIIKNSASYDAVASSFCTSICVSYLFKYVNLCKLSI